MVLMLRLIWINNMRNFRKEFFQFQKIAMDLQIEDAIGKKVSALLVVTEAIKYIRERALACLARHQPQMREHQVQWVLTVPSIWKQSATNFMQAAATKARALCF